MHLPRYLVHILYTIALLNLPSVSLAKAAEVDTKRPIYAIAHRVLTPEEVTYALSHGANALEVDLTAWFYRWWADHDGKLWSAGSSAEELFEHIAAQRRTGQNIAFVWLDIKNPDYCREGTGCSIEGLRDLVRETLEPVGVRALYGFFETEDSRGYGVIRDSMNENEAVCLSGTADRVMELYKSTGTSIPAKQMIMDYGGGELEKGFGQCPGDSGDTCTELWKGSKNRDDGKLGKIFGWTSREDDTEFVDKMLGEASVDGIIYGFPNDEYKDDSGPRAAGQDIIEFVRSHSDTHRMATRNDPPW
ncbi:phospholipase d [Aspergillus sclerotialis]|uniref:Phospholipase d n=1 Tax=Aspergillus sclerotialis TaxID=2070753 RepID=A0A3A2ZJW8_9EURO|nr:phospholipase d [Aspergillus sclerotialis]